MLEESYQGLFADPYSPLVVNANIFDLNLEEETFEKLSLDELKQRKVVAAHPQIPSVNSNSSDSSDSASANFINSTTFI